jgi:hypothetical protein
MEVVITRGTSFALFSGECGLVPSELEMQVGEDTMNFDEVDRSRFIFWRSGSWNCVADAHKRKPAASSATALGYYRNL